MAGSNPFARVGATVVESTSGFERLPADYVKLCERIGGMMHRSPQNRRVRDAADRIMAARRKESNQK